MTNISLFAHGRVTLARITLATALSASIGHAALLDVTNPSFEQPSIADGSFLTTAPPTGWVNYGYIDQFAGRDVGVLNPTGTALYPNPVPNGSNVAVVFLLTGGPTESGIQQTLTATLQAGMQYTLNVNVGNIAPDGGPFNFTGFPGYRVDLLAGGQLIASDNNSLSPAEGEFLESTVSFIVGDTHPLLGQSLGIRLVSLDGPNGIVCGKDHPALREWKQGEPDLGVVFATGILSQASHHRCSIPTTPPDVDHLVPSLKFRGWLRCPFTPDQLVSIHPSHRIMAGGTSIPRRPDRLRR